MKKIFYAIIIFFISFTFSYTYYAYYALYHFWTILKKNEVSYVEYQFPKIYYIFNEDKNQDYKYLIRIHKDRSFFIRVYQNYDIMVNPPYKFDLSKYIKYIEKEGGDYSSERMETIEYILKNSTSTHNLLSLTNNKDLLKLFLKYGADIESLELIYYRNNRDMFDFFLSQGADINLEIYNRNLLHLTDKIEFIKYLIKNGIDINYKIRKTRRDKSEDTPLVGFIKKYNKTRDKKYIEIIEVLLKSGADVRDVSYPKSESKEIIRLLTLYSPNSYEKNFINYNTENLNQLFNMIIEGDMFKIKWSFMSILIDIFHRLDYINYKFQKLFIKEPLINIRDNKNQNKLYYAKSDKEANLLILKGININNFDKNRDTPIMFFIKKYYVQDEKTKKEYKKIIELLLKYKVNLVGTLFSAKNIEIIELLEKNGVDIKRNNQSIYRKNLIYYVEDLDVIKYLIKRGINIHHKLTYSHINTPLMTFTEKYNKSKDNKYIDIIEFLLKQKINTKGILKVIKDRKISNLMDKYGVHSKSQFTSLIFNKDKYSKLEIETLKLFIKDVKEIIKNSKLDLSKTKYATDKFDFVAETMRKVEAYDEFELGIDWDIKNIEIKFRRSYCKVDCNSTDLIKTIRSIEKIWSSYGCFIDIKRRQINYDDIFRKIKLLLKNGTDTSHSLFVTSDIKIVELLFKYGVDIEKTNNNGLTPLLYHLKYVKDFNYQMIELLIEKGANLYTKDKAGKNSLYYLAHALKLSIKEVEDIIKNGKLDLSKSKYAGYQKPRPDTSYEVIKKTKVDFVAETMKKTEKNNGFVFGINGTIINQ